MLFLHRKHGDNSTSSLSDIALPERSDIVWIDLLHPTRDEELEVEQWLDLSLPTREDMSQLEDSSRLYEESDAAFLTAEVAFFGGESRLKSEPVTFVLGRGKLVTIRYIEPHSFGLFAEAAARRPALCATGATALANLMEVLVDRTAELIDKASRTVDELSRQIFDRRRRLRLEALLIRLGDVQNDMAKVRNSLASLTRLTTFATTLEARVVGLGGRPLSAWRDHIRTLNRDLVALGDHASYVTGNIGFLLNAALGLINIEQNKIVKVISITSAIFLPLTLIASIYGMNFAWMPALHQPWGFWAVISVMAVIVVGLLSWMKAHRWL